METTTKNRSYAVRRQLDGAGEWAVEIVELDNQLRRLGYDLGDQVTLSSTINAGFRGIEASGHGPTGAFHGCSLGLFKVL